MSDKVISKNFSGIVLHQDGESDFDDSFFTISNENWYYQEFYLPADYIRGVKPDQQRTPALTGFHVGVGVVPTYTATASLSWVLERYAIGIGWETLRSGTEVGAQTDSDESWFHVFFNDELDIHPDFLKNKYRIGVQGRGAINATRDSVVSYDGKQVVIGTDIINAILEPDEPYPVTLSTGEKGFLLLHQKVVTYSIQQGVNKLWYTAPNPWINSNVKAFAADGITPLRDPQNREVSLRLRVLASTVDEGLDWLGNPFRSVVVANSAGSVSTFVKDFKDKYWLSQPNPSQFAVESLYFDMQDGPVVIDHIYMDPITPNIFFNVYYSDEGPPGQSLYEWENKLWTRIPQTFQARARETHQLPDPIIARYIKIEFSHLQATSYSAAQLQAPIPYRKFPKWVLDYFLLRTNAKQTTEDPFTRRREPISYNALDLAYNYYLDDIAQEPNSPQKFLIKDRVTLQEFLSTRDDNSDDINADTLNKISLIFNRYQNPPGDLAKPDTLLGVHTRLDDQRQLRSGIVPDYPTESPPSPLITSPDVSSTNRDAVIFEKSQPVMYFWLTARHRYRKVSAPLSHDRAYFAGIRELAFTREHFTAAYDHQVYTERGGDLVNLELNDFVNTHNVWTVY